MPTFKELFPDDPLFRMWFETWGQLNSLQEGGGPEDPVERRAWIKQAEHDVQLYSEKINERHIERVNAMADLPELVIADLGGACPVQGEGTYRGKLFYFRARGENWSLSIDLGAEHYPLVSDFETWGEYGDEEFAASTMPLDDAIAFIRQGCLEYDAHLPIRDAAKAGELDAVTWAYVLWKWHYGTSLLSKEDAEMVVRVAQVASLEEFVESSPIGRFTYGYRAGSMRRCFERVANKTGDGVDWLFVDLLHRAAALVAEGEAPSVASLLKSIPDHRRELFWTLMESFAVLSRRDEIERAALLNLVSCRRCIEEGMA